MPLSVSTSQTVSGTITLKELMDTYYAANELPIPDFGPNEGDVFNVTLRKNSTGENFAFDYANTNVTVGSTDNE